MPSHAVYINKIAAFFPNSPVANDEMESLLGQVGGRPSRARKMILRSNKITSRYYAIDPLTLQSNFTNAQLAAQAIARLEGDDFSLTDIETLVCSTTMPDQTMPNHAVMVHGELKNPPCEVVSTAGVCVCGVTALKYGYASVLAGLASNAVVSASECASAIMRAERFQAEDEQVVEQMQRQPELAFEKDFLRWMLSDGAGAMLLSRCPNDNGLSLKIDWIDVYSYANEMPACMYAGAVKNDDGSLTGWMKLSNEQKFDPSCLTITQDVKQLNESVVAYTIEKTLADIIKKRALNSKDYDYFLPHFSSGYFEDRVFEALNRIGFPIAKENWFTNLYTKGNTGSASIYIMLEELFNSGALKSGQKILGYVPESGRFSSAFFQLTVV